MAADTMVTVDDKELSDIIAKEGDNILSPLDTYSCFFDEYNAAAAKLEIERADVLIGSLERKALYLSTEIKHLGEFGQIMGNSPLKGDYITKMPYLVDPKTKASSCDGCWAYVRISPDADFC